MNARCLSFWFDDAGESRLAVIGDADWETTTSPLVGDGRQLVRFEIEQANAAIAVDVTGEDENEIRIDGLPSGYALVCGVTRDDRLPILSILAPTMAAEVFAVFNTACGEVREFVGIFNAKGAS